MNDTAAPFPPPRIGVLVPGLTWLLETFAGVLREHTGADDVQVRYERAAGPVGNGEDPQGLDDRIRYLALARHGSSWTVAASSSTLYLGAGEEAHEDAVLDALGTLAVELGGPDVNLRR